MSANMKELFGSSDEEGDDEQQQERQQQARAGSASPRRQQEDEALEDDLGDEDAPAQQQQQQRTQAAAASSDDDAGGSDQERAGDRDRYKKPPRAIAPPMDIDAPLAPLPAPNSIHLLRQSNIIDVEPRPFDPATFEPEQDTHYTDEKGNVRVRLNSHKMRWRMRRGPDGRELRESNARFVRWSDGSLQLLVGNEVLDVQQQDISHSNYYLFVVRGILQGQTQLSSRMAFRPASLDSALHRKLREAVDKRHAAGVKISRHGGLQNPEADKLKREAAVEAQIKSREQLQRKQDKVMARYGGRPSRPTRMSENYLEEDQEWEEGGTYDEDDELGASERARAALGRRRGMDAQEEAEAARRLQSAKRPTSGSGAGAGGAAKKRRRALSDEEDEEEEEDSEEEEEYVSSGAEEEEEEEREGKKARKGGDARPGAREERGGGGGGSGGGGAAEASMKARRGVVLSDDED